MLREDKGVRGVWSFARTSSGLKALEVAHIAGGTDRIQLEDEVERQVQDGSAEDP